MALRRAGISEACGGWKGISHGGEGLSKGLNMGKYLRKGQEQFEGRIRGNRIMVNTSGEEDSKFGAEEPG